jgi:hypothetical protein
MQEERLHLRERNFIRSEEIKMFKRRFFLIVAVLSLALATLAVSQPISSEPRETRNLDAYHQSERTLVDPRAGLDLYQRSEHTYVDPQAGMEIYHLSERTRTPVRFNPYQLSEWFGQ